MREISEFVRRYANKADVYDIAVEDNEAKQMFSEIENIWDGIETEYRSVYLQKMSPCIEEFYRFLCKQDYFTAKYRFDRIAESDMLILVNDFPNIIEELVGISPSVLLSRYSKTYNTPVNLDNFFA